jgi:YD repeat-containing protein
VFALKVSGQTSNQISYVYDDLGRLVAVVDPNGDTATYSYDAVGNLLSISRYASSSVSLIHFTPRKGPVGTTVTIYGTGFSSTPSQNSVTFNGVAATVSSATSTQLVTSVPSGATTGLISVTTSSGSASSSTPFIVGNSDAPTISGFSPTIGGVGTSVNIAGANFETIPGYNKVKVNATRTQVSTASTTSIVATVAALTTSGRLSVSTPNGSAVSVDDFFVSPAPYAAADVAYTGRMAIGEVKTITVGTGNKIGIVVFDGNAGQRVSFGISSGTMGWAQISVLTPSGTNLMAPTWVNGSGFIDTKILPITGTYSIVIDPEDANTGSINVQLYDVPPDFSGTLTAGGSSLTVTTTTPGQNGRITFQASANEKVFLVASSVMISGTSWWSLLSILKPDGSTLLSPIWVNGNGKTFDTITLPASGLYTIVVDPEMANIGSMVLTLYHPSLTNDDFADAAVISGSSSSVTGTNVGATKEPGEPNHAGQVGGKSAWYRWQPSQSGNVTISTAASNFDTLLGVYTGTSVNSLTTIASNDDDSPSHTSRLTFDAVANTTYYIAVDGFDNTTGNIVLNWTVENTAELKGDYQFQNTRASSTGNPPDVADLGTNAFASATVDGTSSTVLSFSQNNGLCLSPTTGVLANDAYTVVVLFSLAQTNGYRRIADFKNGTSEHGLYVESGHLYFYPASYATAVSISDNTYVQVVLTREANGVVTGYVNGTQQFQFTDTGGIASIGANNALRFFRDDGSEASAGSVARIRVYNGALTATQVAGLDRLP